METIHEDCATLFLFARFELSNYLFIQELPNNLPFWGNSTSWTRSFHFGNLNYQFDNIILFFQSSQVLLCMYHATLSEINETFASNSAVKFLLRQSLAFKDSISTGACIKIKLQQ